MMGRRLLDGVYRRRAGIMTIGGIPGDREREEQHWLQSGASLSTKRSILPLSDHFRYLSIRCSQNLSRQSPVETARNPFFFLGTPQSPSPLEFGRRTNCHSHRRGPFHAFSSSRIRTEIGLRQSECIQPRGAK